MKDAKYAIAEKALLFGKSLLLKGQNGSLVLPKAISFDGKRIGSCVINTAVCGIRKLFRE